MKRRVCYVSGTRADFGLMERTLKHIQQSPVLDLEVCVTGMHLSPTYGETVGDIEQSGLKIGGRVPVDLETNDGPTMARALARELLGFVDVFVRRAPQLVMVMGDRGEMLAAALAAIHLNIPIVHVHGGERSGTVDEPVRHAISKLAHYHFVSTTGARERLIRMGEKAAHIFVTGAPGLVGLTDFAHRPRPELFRSHGFDPDRPLALLVFHPVVQTADQAGAEMTAVLEGVLAAGPQMLCLMPNADAGGGEIRQAIARFQDQHALSTVTHFARDDYLSWLSAADVLVGNSSSGIIEAASFGTPVVNVGDRQQGRERNHNTVDVPAACQAIQTATVAALADHDIRLSRYNIYGDGKADERIVELLSILPLDPSLLKKTNEY